MSEITELLSAVTKMIAATNESNELQRERIEKLESQQQNTEAQTAAIVAVQATGGDLAKLLKKNLTGPGNDPDGNDSDASDNELTFTNKGKNQAKMSKYRHGHRTNSEFGQFGLSPNARLDLNLGSAKSFHMLYKETKPLFESGNLPTLLEQFADFFPTWIQCFIDPKCANMHTKFNSYFTFLRDSTAWDDQINDLLFQMYKSCSKNDVDVATFISLTYIATPSTPLIPAIAAANGNPATSEIPAKSAVYVQAPFHELIIEEWPWGKYNKYENCSILHENVSESTSETVLPTHVFNKHITSSNHEGLPWFIYLGPFITAYRANIVGDPDIWKNNPLARYKTLGDAAFIGAEYLDRGEFDALSHELFILYIKLTNKVLILSKNEGKMSQLNKAVDIIRRDSIACHIYTLHKWVLAHFCMLDVKSLQNFYSWYDHLINNPAGFIWPNECELNWILALLELLVQINKRSNKKAPWHQDETTLFFRVLHILSIRLTIEECRLEEPSPRAAP